MIWAVRSALCLSVIRFHYRQRFDFRCKFAYAFGMSSEAWVVTCAGCKCIIVCFACDPQSEHGRGAVEPPGDSAVLECLCCGSTYRYGAKDIVRDHSAIQRVSTGCNGNLWTGLPSGC